MKQIDLNGKGFALVDDEQFEKLNQQQWYLAGTGRAYNSGGRVEMAALVIGGYKPGYDIDHIDQNRLNNQLSNLRYITRSQNMMNVGTRKDNTSGFKGVSFQSTRNKWLAYINKDGKRFILGRFTTAVEAAKAYNVKAKQLYGNIAQLNEV